MGEIDVSKFKIIDKRDDFIEENLSRPNMNYWKEVFRKIINNKAAMAAILILLIMCIMSIIGPSLTSYKYDIENKALANKFPSALHIFGTDIKGRDIFVRVWKSMRTSFAIGFIVAFINISIGVVFGAICVYYGGLVDDITMRIIEILTSIPSLLLMIELLMIFRIGVVSMIIAMGLVGWCSVARLMRGQLLQIKQQEYVLAAQALGANPSRVITKHLITNVLNIAIVSLALEIPNAILNEIILSFIGFGVPEPLISFGNLFRDSYENIRFYSYQMFIPGIIISLTLISLNILGDALAEALDYRLN